MNLLRYRSFYFLLLFCFACNEPTDQKQNQLTSTNPSAVNAQGAIVNTKTKNISPIDPKATSDFNFKYNLSQWVSKMILDLSLTEISGLAYLDNKKQLLAINDEIGEVFFLDAQDGSIVHNESFAKKGDYEAIALVNDEVYISKSNGNLYHFNMQTEEQTQKIKTAFNESNDIEGMCYDAKEHRLLIACKGNPGLKKESNKKSHKSVYAFDLNKNKLQKDPFLVIKDKQLEQWVQKNIDASKISKKRLIKYLDRVKKFSPSAIAIHPIEQVLYLLSTVGKVLVICQTDGSIEHIEFLNDNHQRQPEGLCFSPKGDLYISNEGKGFPGIIYKYNYVE